MYKLKICQLNHYCTQLLINRYLNMHNLESLYQLRCDVAEQCFREIMYLHSKYSRYIKSLLQQRLAVTTTIQHRHNLILKRIDQQIKSQIKNIMNINASINATTGTPHSPIQNINTLKQSTQKTLFSMNNSAIIQHPILTPAITIDLSTNDDATNSYFTDDTTINIDHDANYSMKNIDKNSSLNGDGKKGIDIDTKKRQDDGCDIRIGMENNRSTCTLNNGSDLYSTDSCGSNSFSELQGTHGIAASSSSTSSGIANTSINVGIPNKIAVKHLNDINNSNDHARRRRNGTELEQRAPNATIEKCNKNWKDCSKTSDGILMQMHDQSVGSDSDHDSTSAVAVTVAVGTEIGSKSYNSINNTDSCKRKKRSNYKSSQEKSKNKNKNKHKKRKKNNKRKHIDIDIDNTENLIIKKTKKRNINYNKAKAEKKSQLPSNHSKRKQKKNRPMGYYCSEFVEDDILKFECVKSNCDKIFTRKATAYAHYIAKHTTRFQCKICQSCFSDSNALTNHNRVHTGERPFKCTFKACKKSFRTKTLLGIHLSIHTGEKKYQCNYCNKRFAVKQGRDVHERIHTGVRPYKCRFKNCKKRFAQSGNRNKHELTHAWSN